MKLSEIMERYRPESWGRNETWQEHARRLWTDEPEYMARLRAHMVRLGGWFYKPVPIDDDVVQDGHHRIVVAIGLGWTDLDVPLEMVSA